MKRYPLSWLSLADACWETTGVVDTCGVIDEDEYRDTDVGTNDDIEVELVGTNVFDTITRGKVQCYTVNIFN